MEKPEFIVVPGVGEMFRQTLHFSSAVKVGNRVETSGQGGWNDDLRIPAAIEEEIAAAFRNIELVLAAAGATWSHVIHVNTYHVGGFPPVANETIARFYLETPVTETCRNLLIWQGRVYAAVTHGESRAVGVPPRVDASPSLLAPVRSYPSHVNV